MAEIAGSLQEAAQVVSKRQKNSDRVNKTRKKVLKEGGALYLPTPFFYASGGIAYVLMQTESVRKLQVPILTINNAIVVTGEGTSEAQIGVLDKNKTKPFYYSFASKLKTRKTRKKAGGKQITSQKYTRIWQQISVPADAIIADLIHNVTKWGAKPEVIRIGETQIVVGKIKNLALKSFGKNEQKGLVKTK